MSAVDFVISGGLTAAGLVLSYFRWRRRGARSGIRLAAWSLLASGGIPLLSGRRRARKATASPDSGPAAVPPGGRRQLGPGTGKVAKQGKRGATAEADDDLKDVEEILRRRGIS